MFKAVVLPVPWGGSTDCTVLAAESMGEVDFVGDFNSIVGGIGSGACISGALTTATFPSDTTCITGRADATGGSPCLTPCVKPPTRAFEVVVLVFRSIPLTGIVLDGS